MDKIILITGATSGIGKATAYELAKYKFKLIICGRRKEQLSKIEFELQNFTEVKSLCFDVSINSEVEKSIASLDKKWKNI